MAANPYVALATDYDGTLAHDGQVTVETLDALYRWRDLGRTLILISGRQLDDLLSVFPEVGVFHQVVAENGALLYNPATGQEQLLAEPPSIEFVQRLRDRIHQSGASLAAQSGEFGRLMQAPTTKRITTGRVIVATWQPHAIAAEALIQEMNLDLQVILNKEAVMVLPRGIDKASALKTVVAQLNLAAEQVVGVGDAENDIAFLRACGYAVAVANALPEVKQQVDWVTSGSRGAGVAELITQLMLAEPQV